MSDKEFKAPTPTIRKESMSEEDVLFYLIKYGHQPKFTIEKETYIDDTGEPQIRFYLSNIPKEDNNDKDS